MKPLYTLNYTFAEIEPCFERDCEITLMSENKKVSYILKRNVRESDVAVEIDDISLYY